MWSVKKGLKSKTRGCLGEGAFCLEPAALAFASFWPARPWVLGSPPASPGLCPSILASVPPRPTASPRGLEPSGGSSGSNQRGTMVILHENTVTLR